MSSRQLEEVQELQQLEWLASRLGISAEDLSEQDWSLHEIDGNDGAVYGYRLEFREGSDPEVLAAIVGLQQGNWVNVGFPPEEPDETERTGDEVGLAVGDILVLSHETRVALSKIDGLLDRLTKGGARTPSILGLMAEPTLRIKRNLEADLAELEGLAVKLGL